MAGAAGPLIELVRKRASVSLQDVLAGLFIAAVLFGIGVFMAFLQDRKILDRRTRQLKLRWGVFVPREREVHSFDEFNRVSVFRDVRTSRKRKRTTRRVSYRVCLDAGEGDPIELEDVSAEDEAISDADRIAGFLGLPREGPRSAPAD